MVIAVAMGFILGCFFTRRAIELEREQRMNEALARIWPEVKRVISKDKKGEVIH
jgi:uncharacterized protein YneF (UPF0154 family)